jgi:hypothetical protein
MDAPDVPPWLTTTELNTPVRLQLGHDGASITDWTCCRLTSGAGEALGVWRATGQALMGDTCKPWSLILKGWAAPEPGTVPSAWNAPHREMEMYRSGLLEDLPGGIRAPDCYAATERPDGSVWFWLEDLTDKTEGPWPLDCYGNVARHLGQFNGAYLTERPLPADPCISRDWLRQWVEAAAPHVVELRKVANHPLVRQIYPPSIIEAYTRIWAERHAYYRVLDQLPQTFCHLDAFRRNLFIRQGENGNDETVLIDWGFAGTAGIGEELVALIAASVIFMEVPIQDAQQPEAMVLEGYIEGLRNTGWRGDPDLVRNGYRIATVLRYGIGGVRMLLPILLDERLHPRAEELLGLPMSEIIARNTSLNDWLVALFP